MANYTATTWIDDVPPGTGTPLNAANMNKLEGGTSAALPQQSVFTAGNVPYRNFLTAGDTQPAFQIAGDGKQSWGPGGTTAVDTNLYRDSSGNALKTDDKLIVAATSASANQITIPDTTAGAGLTIGGDTNLYRSGANSLKTDDNFDVSGLLTAANASASGTLAVGSTLTANGALQANTTLTTVGIANFNGSLYANAAFIVPNSNIYVRSNAGRLYFGASDDANLYRPAASSLKTDGSFITGVHLYVNSDAGRVYFGAASDASFYYGGANTLVTPGNFLIGGQLRMNNEGLVGVGNLVSKISIYNPGGVHLGYIPIYVSL